MLDKVDVKNAITWAKYAQQEIGVDWYYDSSIKQVASHYKRFKTEHPTAGWVEFAKVVDWAKTRFNYRPLHVGQLAGAWPYAEKEGFFAPEDLHGFDIDAMIVEALNFEEDPEWRQRLLGAQGEYRDKVYQEWITKMEKEYGDG